MAYIRDVPGGYAATIGGDIDAGETTELMIAAETAIGGISHTTLSFVTMLLQSPDVDLDSDVLVLRSETTGDIAGFGLYRDPEPHVESVTNGWVHPSHRGRGLGTAIVEWGVEQAHLRISNAPEGARVTSLCQAADADTAAADLFTDLGFTADRHEIEMKFVFDAEVDLAPIPDGITIRTVQSDPDVEAVARVSSEAFKDHYGWAESSWDQTLERWANFRAMDEWDDDLVFIAETEGGAVGELVGIRSHGSDAATGYIGSLGVVRSWRGKGLARALLTRAFAAYQARGMRAVALDVDADSLTGATRLYDSIGMKPVRAETAYLIEIRAGDDLVTR
jgi:mycothiol synthase